jgi:hypothetical protein
METRVCLTDQESSRGDTGGEDPHSPIIGHLLLVALRSESQYDRFHMHRRSIHARCCVL